MRHCKKIWRKRWKVIRFRKTPRLKEPERRREINKNSRYAVGAYKHFQVPHYKHIFWMRMRIYHK